MFIIYILTCLISLTIPTDVGTSSEETSLADLFLTIDIYCDSNPDCMDKCFVDLISFVGGADYILAADQEISKSRETVLLETMDGRCGMNQRCLSNLYFTLQQRVVGPNKDGTIKIMDGEIQETDVPTSSSVDGLRTSDKNEIEISGDKEVTRTKSGFTVTIKTEINISNLSEAQNENPSDVVSERDNVAKIMKNNVPNLVSQINLGGSEEWPTEYEMKSNSETISAATTDNLDLYFDEIELEENRATYNPAFDIAGEISQDFDSGTIEYPVLLAENSASYIMSDAPATNDAGMDDSPENVYMNLADNLSSSAPQFSHTEESETEIDIEFENSLAENGDRDDNYERIRALLSQDKDFGFWEPRH